MLNNAGRALGIVSSTKRKIRSSINIKHYYYLIPTLHLMDEETQAKKGDTTSPHITAIYGRI